MDVRKFGDEVSSPKCARSSAHTDTRGREGRLRKSGKGSPRHALCICLGEKSSSLGVINGVTPVRKNLEVSHV